MVHCVPCHWHGQKKTFQATSQKFQATFSCSWKESQCFGAQKSQIVPDWAWVHSKTKLQAAPTCWNPFWISVSKSWQEQKVVVSGGKRSQGKGMPWLSVFRGSSLRPKHRKIGLQEQKQKNLSPPSWPNVLVAGVLAQLATWCGSLGNLCNKNQLCEQNNATLGRKTAKSNVTSLNA